MLLHRSLMHAAASHHTTIFRARIACLLMTPWELTNNVELLKEIKCRDLPGYDKYNERQNAQAMMRLNSKIRHTYMGSMMKKVTSMLSFMISGKLPPCRRRTASRAR